MAAAKAAGQGAQRRRRQPAEKRRLVELTLRAGASLREIAREHGLHPNSLRAWKALYRAGKLEVPVQSTTRVETKPASATFVPVSIVPAARTPRPISRDSETRAGGVVQLVFASGASLRIETGALDAALVCALVAELRR